MDTNKAWEAPKERAISYELPILVTGISGTIASHIGDQFLQNGYKVRGLVRKTDQIPWIKEIFKQYGDRFEVCVVEDLFNDHDGWRRACKGCSAVVDTIAVVDFNPDPSKVIDPTLAMARMAFEATMDTNTIRRFTMLGSSFAVGTHQPEESPHYDASSYNTNVIATLKATAPPYPPEFGFISYTSAKVLHEQQFWKLSQDPRCHFVCNSVIACSAFGRVFDPKHQKSFTTTSLRNLYEGDPAMTELYPPHNYSSLPDIGRAHVMATVDPAMQSKRLLTYAGPFTIRQILGIMKELYKKYGGKEGEKVFVSEDQVTDLVDKSTADNALMREGLQKWFGRSGFESLEETVEANIEDLLP